MSERRMIRRNHFFAVTGISGLAIIALALCGCSKQAPCPPVIPVKPPAPAGGNNPPVVIRGGSVEGIAPTGGSGAGWNQTSATTLQTVNSYDVSVLSLDGVAQTSGGPTGQYSATNLSNNWIVTLYFRDSNGNPTTAKKLTISTSPDTPSKSFIVLTGDGSGEFTSEGIIDSHDIQRYDLTPDPTGCLQPLNGKARNRKCNHVGEIQVQNVPSWLDGTSSPVPNPTYFYCPVGDCDVYIGKQ